MTALHCESLRLRLPLANACLFTTTISMPKSTKDLSYSQQHVEERALERYGLELGTDDYLKLNATVQRARNGEEASNVPSTSTTADEPDTLLTAASGRSAVTLLNDEGGDEQIWGVEWADKMLVCVWSTTLERVTTLLPEGTVVTRRKGTKGKKKGKK
ncbi:hypothetical protein DFH06DRAFT_1215990 [Mycena polygramma]|nr:hypothetical protein DFH06DRAFT_1215990 [Mycena polygramma]